MWRPALHLFDPKASSEGNWMVLHFGIVSQRGMELRRQRPLFLFLIAASFLAGTAALLPDPFTLYRSNQTAGPVDTRQVIAIHASTWRSIASGYIKALGTRSAGPEYRIRRVAHNYVPLRPRGTRTIPRRGKKISDLKPTPTRLRSTTSLQSTSWRILLMAWIVPTILIPFFCLGVTVDLRPMDVSISNWSRFLALLRIPHTLFLLLLRLLKLVVSLLALIDRSINLIVVCSKHRALDNLDNLRQSWARRMHKRQECKEMEHIRRMAHRHYRSGGALKSPQKKAFHMATEAVPFFPSDVPSPSRFYLPEEDGPDSCNPRARRMQDPRLLDFEKQLGSGAFGMVYQVQGKKSGVMMAIKKLTKMPNAADDAACEVRAMLKSQQPRLGSRTKWFPKLYGTYVDDDYFYILMPYYARGDLLTLMGSSGGCLCRPVAIFILAELILAAQTLHHLGIIHRDLKPENILIGEDGHVILADFGVAHIFPDEVDEDPFFADEFSLWSQRREDWRLGFDTHGDSFPLLNPSVDNPHTTSGVFGTPYYAAPEVLAGQDYSYGVDYYSMAMIYHEMVTGYVPLTCGTALSGEDEDIDPPLCLDLGQKDVHKQLISPGDFGLLERMLHSDPFERPSVVEIKTNSLFSNIDWDRLEKRAIPMPSMQAIRKRVAISDSFEYP